MQNELHDRLEYLVNYSSQLIFVSGDSIANQQRTLETFVYQQHDDTEIAYLTAESSMDGADYRRQLCRQLLGQVVGSFVRPLNELLSDLNEHDGPVLIAITQAQHMPDSLLQELWDLVLQSRFAGNKQHLNVLLFGESAWAERAKQWLPSKNTDTPLLISSQSVHAEPGGSELDRLIARRREEFQSHLANRASLTDTATISVLSSRWFIGLMLMLFVAVFGGLVAWHYGSDIRQLFTPLSQPATDQPASAAPGDSFADLFEDEPRPQEAPSASPESADATPTQADTLIADWPNAVRALGDARSENQPDTDDESSQRDPTPSDNGAVTLTPTEDNALPTEPVAQPQTDVAAVADNAPSDNSAPQDGSPQALVTQPALLLEEVRPEDFYIQMAGLSDRTLLTQFINDNKLADLTHVYRTVRYGGDWFVVLFHQPFSSAQQAKGAMQQLPDYQGRTNAFVKNGGQIRKELASASATSR